MAAAARKVNQVAPINCSSIPFLRRHICFSVNPKFNARKHKEKTESNVRVDKDGFRILDAAKLPPPFLGADLDRTTGKKNVFYPRLNLKAPRYNRMPVDQDWTNVWPSAHSFKYSAVPLPVRQGRVLSSIEATGDGLAPEKYANLELMKIPNFLHLTPDHIRKHCMAIKKYTTPWPKNLETEKEMTEAFPLEIVSSDYCFSGPSIRDERARIVTIKFPLKALKMDSHGEDKFIKLVGDRYDENTGLVTMKMDRCPSKIQNLDYLMYQLTALYFESTTVEPWEEMMTEEDMRHTPWGSENSREYLASVLGKDPDLKDVDVETEIQNLTRKKTEELKDELVKRTEAKPVTEKVYYYRVASEQLLNGKNDKEDLEKYKQAVMKLLNLPVSSETSGQGTLQTLSSQDSVVADPALDSTVSSDMVTKESLISDSTAKDSVSSSDIVTPESATETGTQDLTSSKGIVTSETTEDSPEKASEDTESVKDTEDSSSDSESDSSDSSSDEEGAKH